jgi:hypothetical protein
MSKPVIPTKPLKILDSRGMQIPSSKIAQIAAGPVSKPLSTPVEAIERAVNGIQGMLGDNFRTTIIVRHETTTEDGLIFSTDDLESVAHLCLIQRDRAEKAAQEQTPAIVQ